MKKSNPRIRDAFENEMQTASKRMCVSHGSSQVPATPAARWTVPSTFSAHRTNGAERHSWPPVMCSSFPSCHLCILSAARPPPPASRMANTAKRDGRRLISAAQNAVLSTGSIPDAGPSCHMLLVAWGQPPRLSICLTWQESGCGFLQCQDFPESDLCDRESDRNADLTPPVSVSAGLLCVHTCTAKLRGWRGSRYNDLLSCDRWYLTSDLLYWQKYPVCGGAGGMSVGLCSVVTCKMKANEEPDIFRMVSVNQGWHSHQHIWLKHSIQTVKGMKTHNNHGVRTVSKTHVKLIDYIGSIYSTHTHRQTMLYLYITLWSNCVHANTGW